MIQPLHDHAGAHVASVANTIPAQAPSPESDKSREVRLGLVLYGGVSLAIYINGVAREFYRAVRGEGGYRLLKNLIDSDIVVDVISGTSAGGVNGIFLGYALANNRDFSATARLWREHGGISRLLRHPFGKDDAKGKEEDDGRWISLLDSEAYYQKKLEDAFAEMDRIPSSAAGMPSITKELDLFITGTDVNGNVYTVFDDAGHAIDVKDHRAVFLLKYRRGRKYDLGRDPKDGAASPHKALAKLARITSCFPGAFAPVIVKADGNPGSNGSAGNKADAMLQRWGRLTRTACFIDGGVLDNKPFSHTLKAIFSRSADRDVDRKIFWVEPDPETFKTVDKIEAPDFLRSVMTATLGIPRYESIADDLKLISERNANIERFHRLTDPVDGIRPTRLNDIAPRQRAVYERSRILHLGERFVNALLRKGAEALRIDESDRDKVKALIVDVGQWKPVKRHQSLRSFDIDFRIRRAYEVIYTIHGSIHRGKDVAPASDTQCRRWSTLRIILNRYVEFCEIVRAAMERTLENAPLDWRQAPPGKDWSAAPVWDAAGQMMRELLKVDDELAKIDGLTPDDPDHFLEGGTVDDALASLNALLRRRSDEIIKKVRAANLGFRADVPKDRSVSLLTVSDLVIDLVVRMLSGRGEEPLAAWKSFKAIDAERFPLQFASGIHELDVIETIRISPRDATRGFSGARHCGEKVSGDGFYHFAGFLKRSWRGNDILWGRIDGVAQILEALLDPARLRDIGDNDVWRRRVRARFIDESLPGAPFIAGSAPADLFPNAGTETQERIGLAIRCILSDDRAIRSAMLPPEGKSLSELEAESKGAPAPHPFIVFLDDLVAAEQLEVIGAEVPNVLCDALQEQKEWNRYRNTREMVALADALEEAEAQAAEANGGGHNGRAGAGRNGHENGRRNGRNPATPRKPVPFNTKKLWFDPFLHDAVAQDLVGMHFKSFGGSATARRPQETPLGRYFESGYWIGSETVSRDIPTVALIEVMTRGLLVLRNCFLTVLKGRGGRVESHPLFKLGIDWPLKLSYGAARMTRETPAVATAVFFGLMALSVFAFFLGVFFWNDVIVTDKFHLREFLILMGIPGVILVAEISWLIWIGRIRHRLWPSVVVGALGVTAVVLIVLGFTAPEVMLGARERTDLNFAVSLPVAGLHAVLFIVVPILLLFFVYVFIRARGYSTEPLVQPKDDLRGK